MKDFDALEATIKELPEFDDLVKDLANRGFDIAIATVKKIASDLELFSVYQAFETEIEEEKETRTENLATTQAD